MKKEFVPHKESLELKELGFDESCLGFYEFGSMDKEWHLRTKHISKNEYDDDVIYVLKAPTYSQAFRFFREKYNIDAWAQPFMIKNYDTSYSPEYLPDESYVYWIFKDGDFVADKVDFLDFEEAEFECLKKIIEIVKK
jgi:hypothetical protein